MPPVAQTKEGNTMSRIVTNVSANTVYKNYNQNSSALAASLEKLSSGLAINRASDDPAGLAISEDERLQVKGTNMAINVIANANNFINTADGYLQTVNDMLGRMEELAVSYNDSTKAAADLTDLAAEFSALYSEMTINIDAQARFNAQVMFAASSPPMSFQVGADGADVFNITGTGTVKSMVSNANIAYISNIQGAEQNVSTARANLGAAQSQLNFKSTALQNYSVNVSAAESRIRDVDVAQQSTIYAKMQILVQSSTAMLAQANANPQNVLTLLR